MNITSFALALSLAGAPSHYDLTENNAVPADQTALVSGISLMSTSVISVAVMTAPAMSASAQPMSVPAVPATDAVPPEKPDNAAAEDAADEAPAAASGDQAAGDAPLVTGAEAASLPSPTGEDAGGVLTEQGEEEEEGAIIVVAGRRRSPVDPLENLNVKSYEVIQSVDKALVGPMAMGYKENIPKPVRSGVRNFLRNLTEPVVFLNYLLQFKLGKAAETAGRFAINSTLGLAGLFDTAKKEPFNLPYRNNGFGYTFGFYGIKTGPYMYLPLIGPTTLRDVTGRLLDMLVMPFAIGKPFNQPAYAIPTTIVRLLDERAEGDEEHRLLHEEADDPYAAVRENYLRQRQAEIDELRGRRPAPTNESLPEVAPVLLPELEEIKPVPLENGGAGQWKVPVVAPVVTLPDAMPTLANAPL